MNNLIDMGYADTIEILKKLYEFMLIEKEFIEKSETLKIQDNGFKKIVTNNALLRSQYKQLQFDYKDMSSIEYLLNLSKPIKTNSGLPFFVITINLFLDSSVTCENFDLASATL